MRSRRASHCRVFKDAHGKISFKHTFSHDPASRTWSWAMDSVDRGFPKPFGRVKLIPALIASLRPST